MKYACWLHSVAGFGPKSADLMLTNGHCAQDLYHMQREQLLHLPYLRDSVKKKILDAKEKMDPDRIWDRLQQLGVTFYTKEKGSYPQKLREITDGPYGLFVRGALPDPKHVSVAVVGARNCSVYGQMCAKQIGESLASAGVQVISGLARGIDSEAQLGALRTGHKTYAVLGSGINVCYPSEHEKLYEGIWRCGGIISEYPPDRPPLAQQFPQRNRIISGLADCVIVVEAREKSGSLITVQLALEQGRDVYAVPGPMDSALSKGCHLLIQNGAGIYVSAEEFLSNFTLALPQSGEAGALTSLEKSEKLVYSSITLLPKSMEELCEQTGIPMRQLFEILVNLELMGLIKESSKDRFVRTK